VIYSFSQEKMKIYFGRTEKKWYICKTIKNKKKMEQVSYMMNELEIIGAMGKNIYVRAIIEHWNETENEGVLRYDRSEFVCLVFSMTSYMEMQKTYIKNKKKICEMYGHFCGWSDITSDCEFVGYVDMRVEHDDVNEIMEVRALRPKNFQVCMEHG